MAVRLSELETWLNKELEETLKPLKVAAANFYGKTRSTLKDLAEICENLAVKSEKDMAGRKGEPAVYRAARAANRLSRETAEIISAIAVPESLSLDELKSFQLNLQRSIQSAFRVRDEWTPTIKPYYIFDMMSLNGCLDKLNRASKELRDFIDRNPRLEIVKEIRENINDLNKLVREDEKINETIIELNSRVLNIEKTLENAQKSREEIIKKDEVQELLTVEGRLKELRSRLLTEGLRHLSKPLRKFLAIIERGDFFLQLEYKQALIEYLSAPFRSFSKEEEGYPNLKIILLNMGRAIRDKKLGIKEKKARKVLEQIDSIVNGDALLQIHVECRKLFNERKEKLSDEKILTAYREYLALRNSIKNLTKEKLEILRKVEKIKEQKQVLRKQIEKLCEEVERSIYDVTQKRVKIEVDLMKT
jgi:hypothetical protein